MHKVFREAYRHCDTLGLQLEVDLSQVDYMDSAALGMLLLAHRKVTDQGGGVTLVSPSKAIRHILAIAQFQRFMSIRE